MTYSIGVGLAIDRAAGILHRPTSRHLWDTANATPGEAVPKTVRNNTEQKWPTWMKVVQYALLGVGVLATLALPIYLLSLASNVRTDNPTLAQQYSTWSSGLVVLGPSFFMTSFLAMGSKLPLLARVVIGVLGLCLASYIYYQLWRIGEEFYIPAVLGIAGVLYCLVADIFTPDSAYENSLIKNVLSFVIMMVLFLAGIFVLQYLTLDNIWPMGASLTLVFLAFWIPESIMGRSESVPDQAESAG